MEFNKTELFTRCKTTGKRCSKRHTSKKLSVMLTVCRCSGRARDQIQRTKNKTMGECGIFKNNNNNNNTLK